MTWDLIGHEWAIQLLRGHIENNSLRHAYLITGPDGIGKKNLAIRFIQAINCPNEVEPGQPCLVCHTCKRIQRLEYPDVFPVLLEGDSNQIKIDQIRDLVHNLSLSPYEAKQRFGLLIDFELANEHTQNSLLKTLEEPPGSVMLILTARSSASLLETITSRCEEIRLHTVAFSTTSQGLEQLYNIPADQAIFLAHISGGKPETALQYHLDPTVLERRTSLLDDHIQMLRATVVERFAYAAQVVDEPACVQNMLETWLSLWHDLLLQIGQSNAPINNTDRIDEIRSIMPEIDLRTVKNTLDVFRRAQGLIKENANLKLTLEDLLLQLPRIDLKNIASSSKVSISDH